MLFRSMNMIQEAFTNWSNECYRRFEKLKVNEEELNRIFIDIYGLQDELTPEVEVAKEHSASRKIWQDIAVRSSSPSGIR